MDCSMPGLPEFPQAPIHRVSDATQPSHPLSSPSSPAFNLSQHQGLFKRVISRKVLLFLPVRAIMGISAPSFLFFVKSLGDVFYDILLFLPSSKGFFVPLHFLPLEWYHLNI